MMHFKIFDHFDDDLRKSLNQIKDDSFFNVFQLTEWIDTVINNSNDYNKIKIIFVFDGDNLILVAPLCIKNIYGCRELSWISSEILDYNNPIISKYFDFRNVDFKRLWKKIIKDLSGKCDLIFFNKIPAFIDSAANPLVDSKYKFYQKSYQLDLNKLDYDSFYNSKNNNKSKQTDRRKEKKLNHKNDLIFSYININPSNFQLVEDLIFEKMSFYQKKKEKTFNYQSIINKYKKLICFKSNNYKFNLSILKKNQTKISSILGVIFNDVYYYLIPLTHHSEYKKFSPGRFHIVNLIKWTMNNNIKFIDFTAGDESYKSNWSNTNFKMFYYLKLNSIRGLIRFIFLNLYFRLRNIYLLKKFCYFIKYEI